MLGLTVVSSLAPTVRKMFFCAFWFSVFSSPRFTISACNNQPPTRRYVYIKYISKSRIPGQPRCSRKAPQQPLTWTTEPGPDGYNLTSLTFSVADAHPAPIPVNTIPYDTPAAPIANNLDHPIEMTANSAKDTLKVIPLTHAPGLITYLLCIQ